MLDDGVIQLVRGDITRQQVDAFVNAANTSLTPGGGVDGAIHRIAGPELLAACRAIGHCPTGEARLTPGFRLPARFVIHTVAPIWHGYSAESDRLLASCYRSSMARASARGLKSIAFPALGTGAYGFPASRAAEIAIRELRRAARDDTKIHLIRVVAFDAETHAIYRRLLEADLE